MTSTNKTIVLMADLHCGSLWGLTPPQFEIGSIGDNLKITKTRERREACWTWFAKEIKAVGKVDILLLNGDLIDGTQAKQGGLELLTIDVNEQAKIASAVIKFVKPTKVAAVFGTGYHAGDGMDWEQPIVEAHQGKIGGHDYVDVNGLVFDYRHFVSRSSIPHGRATPIAREYLWNLMWAERQEFPKADVIARSHTHYYIYCGGVNWLAVNTPALEMPGTRFGVRHASGTVDFGFVVFHVRNKKDWDWEARILSGKDVPWRQEAVKL